MGTNHRHQPHADCDVDWIDWQYRSRAAGHAGRVDCGHRPSALLRRGEHQQHVSRSAGVAHRTFTVARFPGQRSGGEEIWRDLAGHGGAVIGGIVGLFFSLPGIILGPFLGAMILEMTGDKEFKIAAKAGAGAVIGLLLGCRRQVLHLRDDDRTLCHQHDLSHVEPIDARVQPDSSGANRDG